jgi:hypothetical protein
LSRVPAPSLATASPTPMHVAIGLKTGAGCQQFVVFKRGGCRPMSCQASPDRASRAEVDREHQHRAACSCPLSCGRSASQQFHVELRDSNPDPHTARANLGPSTGPGIAGIYAPTGTYAVPLTAVESRPTPLPADGSSRNPPPNMVRDPGGLGLLASPDRAL